MGLKKRLTNFTLFKKGKLHQSVCFEKTRIKKAFPFYQKSFLWSHLESNQAPTDYESVALTE